MVEITDKPFCQIKNGKLTAEILLTYPSCEHYTCEEAVNIVASLEKFAEIIHEI